jgi:hypothetical protein
MKNTIVPFTAAALLVTCALTPFAYSQSDEKPKSFPAAKIRFEQNATDGDVEVVFEVTGRNEGITTLSVESPDGRMVVDFASDESGARVSGIREFLFESPEPTDVAALKAAFPEGEYTFEGATESGVELHGKAMLSHKLPPVAKIMAPQADAQNVDYQNAKLSWSAVPQVAGYILELEQEDTGVSITAKLSSSDTSFEVPRGFLKPTTEYKLAVGTVSKDGNASFVETSFTTSAKK